MCTTIVESTYFNTDMRKFESSQIDDSKAQWAGYSRAYRNIVHFTVLVSVLGKNEMKIQLSGIFHILLFT